MDTSHDKRQLRCPRLGGRITFKYCRTVDNAPCWKILDCWWEQMDIRRFVEENYSQDVLEALEGASPKPKILSLLELIEQARRNVAGGDEDNNGE